MNSGPAKLETASVEPATQKSNGVAGLNSVDIIPSAFTSPLSEGYCAYFKLLASFSIILAVISLIGVLVTAKKYDMQLFMSTVMVVVVYMISYFQNRLLYSMCTAAL